MRKLRLLFALTALPAIVYGEQAFTKIFQMDEQETAWTHMPSLFEHGNGTTCSQPAEYPTDVGVAAAQVIDGYITLCGGGTTACFSLNAGLNVWVEFPEMDVGRNYAASVMTPAGWWITGGLDNASTSSSLWDGSVWKAGPDLPTRRSEHCMVQVNATHTFLAGGYEGPFRRSDAYLFDWTTETWTKLPSLMPHELARLSCALHQDSQGGRYIVVAGGYAVLIPAFYLDLDRPFVWRILPALPTEVEGGVFVQDGSDVILVNPYHGNLLRFDRDTLAFSVIPDQSTPIQGDSGVVLAIDDESLQGCESAIN